MEEIFTNGYDSDGECALPTIGESLDEYSKPSLLDTVCGNVSTNSDDERVVIIEYRVIAKFKVDELRAELNKKGRQLT